VPLHHRLRCSYDSAVPFGGYKDSGLGREKVRLLLLLLLLADSHANGLPTVPSPA
jgi:acyl-CoA reductase-like NAD-dependent aldehyde dehydrogenase